MIVPLAGAGPECGGKARTLGVLARRGFPVPLGWVVVDPATDAGWPAGAASWPGPFAVRSSGREEDGEQASFAGQLLTELNVSHADLAESVLRVAGSGQGTQAYAKRLNHAGSASVPVLVMPMLAAEVSGVMFTRHPVTGAAETVIEAAPGLGDQIGEGRVTPQRWTGGQRSDAETAGRSRASPREPENFSQKAVLAAAQIQELTELGRRIEAVLGPAQDVEWAVQAGQIWILQARPITGSAFSAARTRPHHSPDATHEPGGSSNSQPTTDRPSTSLLGTASSPGRICAPAAVILSLNDFQKFGPGQVLVCRTTSPAWTPLIAQAAAVVTEVGGILSHAAIVAREFGIPAITEVPDATSRIRPGQSLTVDGTNGVITIEEQP
ncbi:PEP/pyruvate-binding domain-containing protein [Kineosporia babensis]|uniref:Pyruvate, water dikinase n=1 Tax=Kineosporia babensis TaxID=499548 RepID=A0A9X1NGT8_9ACTN|nr:PEP/pyruvate-binding domain-containing protein [Kineosporia babensis]MCD5312858.1 hypothetical protein [Kineosporia babensis]